jgi:thiamine kinase-like enzyme
MEPLAPELLERVAARIPELRGRTLIPTPLEGGLTNRNYLLDGADRRWVLRVTGKAEMLGADREAEYAATVAAAGLGIGPEVLAYLRPDRILITEFVAGTPVPESEMRDPAMIRRVAALLARLHQAPSVPATFSAFGIVETYRDNAVSLGVALPEAYHRCWAIAERLRPLLEDGLRSRCLCHNDMLNANFLDLEGRLYLLDWEYAGMGDPFFDLANFSSNHDLDEDDDRILLEAYAGAVREADLARLRLMRIMSDFREAMWGVVQQGLRTTDADYEAYAAQFFERLEARAADPSSERFEQRLGGSTA